MMEIKQATRTNIKPLIGLCGGSGSGKTLSALLVARGLVGDKGRICLIDTESGRGSIFADMVPGGYSVLELEPPFSPQRYQEAIEMAEKQSDCTVIDSLSHEWYGEGGVLDKAEEELQRLGGGDNNKMRSWIKPKMEHKMMIQRLLRLKIPLIVCLRGEQKTHVQKEAGQKTKVVTDEFYSPIADPRFIFEMLVNFEMVAKNGQGGFVIPRKITHPDINSILPRDGEQIGMPFGKALAEFCKGGKVKKSAHDPIDPTISTAWKLSQKIHGGDRAKFQQHLWDEGYLSADKTLDEMTKEDYRAVASRMPQ